MFKRIEKRQRKKEKAEELGIDENLYDVQDSDSEDSHSDRSGSDDEDSASGSDVYSFSGIGDGIHSEDIMADDIGSDESGEEDQGSDAESDDSSDAPPMTIPEAVENPIYQPSLEKEDRWCIVCPGRIFKNEFMVGTHKDSKSHKRRYGRFIELAQLPRVADKDVRDLVALLSENKPKNNPEAGTLSNRALKRKLKLEHVKARRKTTKEMIAKKKRRKEAKATGNGGEGVHKSDNSEKHVKGTAPAPLNSKGKGNPTTGSPSKKPKPTVRHEDGPKSSKKGKEKEIRPRPVNDGDDEVSHRPSKKRKHDADPLVKKPASDKTGVGKRAGQSRDRDNHKHKEKDLGTKENSSHGKPLPDRPWARRYYHDVGPSEKSRSVKVDKKSGSGRGSNTGATLKIFD